jgi:hypothetical protein
MKYLKYKMKYLALKNQIGSAQPTSENIVACRLLNFDGSVKDVERCNAQAKCKWNFADNECIPK